MPKPETVFQEVERKLDEWNGTGVPPSRAVFRDKVHGISAYVDPFRKLPGTVVVVPHEGTPGVNAYFHLLPDSR